MNLSSTTAAASPRAASNAEQAAPRRRDDAASRDACDAFGRALKGRQQASRRDPEPDDAAGDAIRAAFAALGAGFAKVADAAAEAPSVAAAAASSVPAFARSPEDAPASAAGGPDIGPAGPRATIQAALNAGVPVASLLGSDPAAVWEASLRGPQHLSVDVRAERLVNPGGSSGWALGIGARGVEAELMLRHAPRLNERLRKHGAQLDHVRIESPDDEAAR